MTAAALLIFAILALALRQKRSQLTRRRAPSKGMRSATAGKEDGKFLMPVLLGLMFAAMSFNFSYNMLNNNCRRRAVTLAACLTYSL